MSIATRLRALERGRAVPGADCPAPHFGAIVDAGALVGEVEPCRLCGAGHVLELAEEVVGGDGTPIRGANLCSG
jgi:hypothetical protein